MFMFYTLITGATGGLGRAFVYETAKRGDNLVLTGTNLLKLEKIVSDIKADYPSINVAWKACDLSSENDRDSFFDFLKLNNIKINFLINNAGFILEGEFLKCTREDVIKAIRVNCEGTIDVTRWIVENRDKNEELNVITVSSLAGYYPMPYMSIYAATKAMLKNFMVALNYELRDENVFITTICPSGIPTTTAMKEAIDAQGTAGHMTMSTPLQVAKIALNASKKHKVIVVPKAINRFIKNISKPLSEKMLAKTVGKRWKRSQDKRNFYSEGKNEKEK